MYKPDFKDILDGQIPRLMRFQAKVSINVKILLSPREKQGWLLRRQRQKENDAALFEAENKVNQSRELLNG